MRVYDIYQHEISSKDAVKALKNEYGTGGHSHTFLSGARGNAEYSPSGGIRLWRYEPKAEVKLTWVKVEKRLRQMVQEGTYLTPAELERYQSIYQKPARVSNGITNMDVDKLLVEDFGIVGRKQRIYALYQQGLSDKEIADHLRAEYNTHGYTPEERAHHGICVLADGGSGYGYFVAAEWRLRRRDVDGPMRCIKYKEMAGRIRALIDQGRYLTQDEIAQLTPAPEPEAPPPTPEPKLPGPAPVREITQADVDAALQEWNGDMDSKCRVQRYMTDHSLEKGTADWLRGEYGDDLPAFPVTVEGAATDLPWSKVQRHLARLVKEDRFFTEQELDNFEDIDPAAIREQLESGEPSAFVEQVMVDVEQIAAEEQKRTVREVFEQYKPVITGLVLADDAYQNACRNSDRETAVIEGDAAVKRAALTVTDPDFMRLYYDMPDFRYRLHRAVIDETYAALSAPHEAMPEYDEETPPWGVEIGIHSPWGKVQESKKLVEGIYQISTPGHGGIMVRETDANNILSSETISAGGIENGWCYFEEDAVAPIVIRELTDKNLLGEADRPARDPLAPAYKVGDTVYLNDTAYTITDVNLFDVQLQDPTLAYPILRSEPKERFERLIRLDERNAHLFTQEPELTPTPEVTPGNPGDKNGIPFDVVVQRLSVDEPEQAQPEQDAPRNFRITDDHLGEGGLKEKFRRNLEAVTTLHEIEFDKRDATPAEQEILSRYVGWGALADAFDPKKPDWANEYKELQVVLTPEEYESARASTLNAHYARFVP